MSLVPDTSAADIAAALDQVGARLKRLRTQRRMTLLEHTSGGDQPTTPRTELIPPLLGHDDSLHWSHARHRPQATIKAVNEI